MIIVVFPTLLCRQVVALHAHVLLPEPLMTLQINTKFEEARSLKVSFAKLLARSGFELYNAEATRARYILSRRAPSSLRTRRAR